MTQAVPVAVRTHISLQERQKRKQDKDRKEKRNQQKQTNRQSMSLCHEGKKQHVRQAKNGDKPPYTEFVSRYPMTWVQVRDLLRIKSENPSTTDEIQTGTFSSSSDTFEIPLFFSGNIKERKIHLQCDRISSRSSFHHASCKSCGEEDFLISDINLTERAYKKVQY